MSDVQQLIDALKGFEDCEIMNLSERLPSSIWDPVLPFGKARFIVTVLDPKTSKCTSIYCVEAEERRSPEVDEDASIRR